MHRLARSGKTLVHDQSLPGRGTKCGFYDKWYHLLITFHAAATTDNLMNGPRQAAWNFCSHGKPPEHLDAISKVQHHHVCCPTASMINTIHKAKLSFFVFTTRKRSRWAKTTVQCASARVNDQIDPNYFTYAVWIRVPRPSEQTPFEGKIESFERLATERVKMSLWWDLRETTHLCFGLVNWASGSRKCSCSFAGVRLTEVCLTDITTRLFVRAETHLTWERRELFSISAGKAMISGHGPASTSR